MVNQSIDLQLAALADPTRRALIEQLVRSPAPVSELAIPFAMSLPAILKHIAVLELAGLVVTRKVGRVRTCRVEPSGLRDVESWIATQRAEWEHKLDALERHLDAGRTDVIPPPTEQTNTTKTVTNKHRQ